MIKHLIFLCISLLFIFSCQAAEFDLGHHGTLAIVVSDGWNVHGSVLPNSGGRLLGYTLAIIPRSDQHAKCLLTFFFPTNGAPDKNLIRKDVLRISEEFVDGSVERTKNLRDFSLEKGYGAYCFFTDASLVGKNSAPGDYKVMAVGEIQPAKNILANVSLFADADDQEFKMLIKIINSITIKTKLAK